MDSWSNEKALLFIEVLQTEPSLWDPRSKGHKNSSVQGDAWRRILEALPFESSIEELKKKKESLMGYYRTHLNKYKKSLKSGAGSNDIYHTNWFAYDAMHSFLEPIYAGNSTLNTETQSPIEPSIELSIEEPYERLSNELERVVDGPSPVPSPPQIQQRPNLNKRHSSSSTNNVVSFKYFSSVFRRDEGSHNISGYALNNNVFVYSAGKRRLDARTVPTELTSARKQMDEAFQHLKSFNKEPSIKSYDQFDHFGAMIAAKIRSIHSFVERETLMNEIQNKVFQCVFSQNARNSDENVPYFRMPSDETQEDQFILPEVHSVTSQSILAEEQPFVTAAETDYQSQEHFTHVLDPSVASVSSPISSRKQRRVIHLSNNGKIHILSNEAINSSGSLHTAP